MYPRYEFRREIIMRTLFGMVLGCLLTIVVVYFHDTLMVSTGDGNAAASASRAIVNWDVARSEWGNVTETARTDWLKLRTSIIG